jgi:hypothetical protein
MLRLTTGAYNRLFVFVDLFSFYYNPCAFTSPFSYFNKIQKYS